MTNERLRGPARGARWAPRSHRPLYASSPPVDRTQESVGPLLRRELDGRKWARLHEDHRFLRSRPGHPRPASDRDRRGKYAPPASCQTRACKLDRHRQFTRECQVGFALVVDGDAWLFFSSTLFVLVRRRQSDRYTVSVLYRKLPASFCGACRL